MLEPPPPVIAVVVLEPPALGAELLALEPPEPPELAPPALRVEPPIVLPVLGSVALAPPEPPDVRDVPLPPMAFVPWPGSLDGSEPPQAERTEETPATSPSKDEERQKARYEGDGTSAVYVRSRSRYSCFLEMLVAQRVSTRGAPG